MQGGEEPGSGLGLSIVWRIAELHRATVTAEANPGGRGSCFRVVFAPAQNRNV